jgi:two-component system response regulator YesN
VTARIRKKKEEQDHIITFVFDYIENHYMDDLSLDMVAEKLKITGGYLSSYFKDKTGMNFSDYLNKLRIEKAKQFLQKPNLRVQDVAEHVGYNNVVSFIRMFKRITGQTPGEYRRNV